ncbi:hypothetical protein SAMN05443244_3796 [Terriglobus roseus]|uniref:Uncharacterized protein n=1 Tax=Terriglobus roseus TaxID=392734 RepID=A0A1H4TLP3_9BACT|nr:hypothetical protein SAMN05443244_3796 [Terriglobus roseus]
MRPGLPFLVALTVFEVLNRAFMLLCRSACGKGAQVFPLARLLVGRAGVDAIFTGFEFADHEEFDWRQPTTGLL